MTVELPSPAALDCAIGNLAKQNDILSATSIADPAYPVRVQAFIKALTDAARLHRNWNDTMQSIDGMIDYDTPDEEFPVGYRKPAVEHNDYTGYEEDVEEAFYCLTCVDLERFKIEDIYMMNKMFNHVGSLYSYSTKWDIDHGIFAD
ncbi:MAG: hypothetical protein H9W81_09860 [Enterococcus sp.]|nr:hypothetical protein [Enterococcus sp.]